ncbi:MAG TPA: hypothetical protein P5164_01275 [Thermoanaerobaculia bacterium]|nr:hypothetical protein [Thermoanaerobaculia bacterium]
MPRRIRDHARARTGRRTVPLLKNVGETAKECCARLGVRVPKVSDVADIATRAPQGESCRSRFGKWFRISDLTPAAC